PGLRLLTTADGPKPLLDDRTGRRNRCGGVIRTGLDVDPRPSGWRRARGVSRALPGLRSTSERPSVPRHLRDCAGVESLRRRVPLKSVHFGTRARAARAHAATCPVRAAARAADFLVRSEARRIPPQHAPSSRTSAFHAEPGPLRWQRPRAARGGHGRARVRSTTSRTTRAVHTGRRRTALGASRAAKFL